MVRFSVRLRDNIYGEWRSDYLDYKGLKAALKAKKLATSQPTTTPKLTSRTTDSFLLHSSELWAGRASMPVLRCSSSQSNLRQRKRYPGFALSETELQSLVQKAAPLDLERLLQQEYNKVDRAYTKHLTYLSGQFDLLREQYRPQADQATQESVKNTLVELYRLLNHLLNFALLNYTGFVQIFKKHDALFAQKLELQLASRAKLYEYSFHDPTQCRTLLNQVALMFSDLYCEGNSSVAVSVLMTRKEDAIDWAPIYIGIKIGSCLVLLVWVAWDSLVMPSFQSERSHNAVAFALTKAFPLYRGIGCCLLLHWLIGVSIYVWRSARINYRYMFEVNPRRTPHYSEIFSDATNMSLVYLINVLLYYKVVNGYLPEKMLSRGYYPVSLFFYTIYFYIIRPWRRQRGLWRTVLEIVGAPFFPVTFFHVFVANYITSFIKVLEDLAWSVCFITSKEFLLTDSVETPETGSSCHDNHIYVKFVVPLICALPLWWRFLQNLRRVYDTASWWPHLPCAFMYALAQVVSLFALFHPFYSSDEAGDALFHMVWLGLFTVSSLYTWIWDVWMDWGLGRPQFHFLSDRHMFSHEWVYYAAMVADFFLRFAWTLTLIPPQSSNSLPLYLQPCTMVLELFRRTLWGFFRLENEHLRNTQGFRRVDFIPLHYDHGVGDEPEQNTKSAEPMQVQVLLVKILLIMSLVVALSVLAINVDN